VEALEDVEIKDIEVGGPHGNLCGFRAHRQLTPFLPQDFGAMAMRHGTGGARFIASIINVTAEEKQSIWRSGREKRLREVTAWRTTNWKSGAGQTRS
jgi:hypothetical protein